MQYVPIFVDITKIADFLLKMLISTECRGCVTGFISFLNLRYARNKCAKFYHCRICVTDFRDREAFLPTLLPEQLRKGPP